MICDSVTVTCDRFVTVTCDITLIPNFFLKNQQFIIQGLVADCNNYSVVIYIQKDTTWKEKLKRKREEEGERREEKENKEKNQIKGKCYERHCLKKFK